MKPFFDVVYLLLSWIIIYIFFCYHLTFLHRSLSQVHGGLWSANDCALSFLFLLFFAHSHFPTTTEPITVRQTRRSSLHICCFVKSALWELHSFIETGQYLNPQKSFITIIKAKAKEGEICLINNTNIFVIQFNLPSMFTKRWVLLFFLLYR